MSSSAPTIPSRAPTDDSIVIMFVRPGCPYCRRAEEALRKYKIPYKTRLMDSDRAGFRAMLVQAGHGQRTHEHFTVPQIFVRTENRYVEHIGGCDELIRRLDDGS